MNTLVKTLQTKEIPAHELQPHMLLRKIGLMTGDDMEAGIEFFANESKALGHYNSICVTKNYKIISQPEVWQAAIKVDSSMLLTVDVLDIEDDDLIRFINAKSIFIHRDYKASWALIRELRKYLEENPKGQVWFKELQAGDIIETLHHRTRRSNSLIKQYQAIGKYADANPTLNVWEDIGKGKKWESLRAAAEEIRDLKETPQKPGKFPLNDAEREQQEEKEKQRQQKMRVQNIRAEKLKGDENINVTLVWKKEGKTFKGIASNPFELATDRNPSARNYYVTADNGSKTLIKITVDVPEVFKRVTNNPINLKP